MRTDFLMEGTIFNSVFRGIASFDDHTLRRDGLLKCWMERRFVLSGSLTAHISGRFCIVWRVPTDFLHPTTLSQRAISDTRLGKQFGAAHRKQDFVPSANQ